MAENIRVCLSARVCDAIALYMHHQHFIADGLFVLPSPRCSHALDLQWELAGGGWRRGGGGGGRQDL